MPASAKSTPLEVARCEWTSSPRHVILTEVAYLTCTSTFFDIPVHPRNAPVHANTATGLQIAETIRQSNQAIADHLLYERVKSALKQRQILLAVENRNLQFLEDLKFGFPHVVP